MMRGLIELAKSAEDERVRSVCLVAVLDRAGIRPIDKPEPEQEPRRPRWDPRKYSIEELDVIRAGLRLMLEDRREKPAASEPEVLTPRDEDGRR
jgi:hypothetical protein